MKSKNFSRFLWVLIVATQFFFFISALKSNHTRTADSAEYLNMAYNLQHHGLIYSGDAEAAERDLSLYSRRTPGYPLFLLVSMIGIGSGILPLAMQCLLSLLSIYLGSRILRSIHPAETAQSLYLALLLFFPSQFIYPAFYMTETLFQSALLLSIFFLFRFEERGTYSLYYLHHFFLAAMYLVKPAAMFLWLGVTLYSIFSHHFVGVNRRQVFISLLHILLLGSIFIKNHQRTGIAEYSSIGRKLIINYNLPDLLTYTKGADYSARVIDSLQQQLKNESYAAQCAITDQFVRGRILSQPISYLYVHLKGSLRFFLETCRWDLELWRNGYEALDQTPSLRNAYREHGLEGVMQITRSWPPAYLAYVALVGLTTPLIFILFLAGLLRNYIPRKHRLLFAGIAFYFALVTGPSSSARFRLPVMPLIAMVAATAFLKGPEKIPDAAKKTWQAS